MQYKISPSLPFGSHSTWNTSGIRAWSSFGQIDLEKPSSLILPIGGHSPSALGLDFGLFLYSIEYGEEEVSVPLTNLGLGNIFSSWMGEFVQSEPLRIVGLPVGEINDGTSTYYAHHDRVVVFKKGTERWDFEFQASLSLSGWALGSTWAWDPVSSEVKGLISALYTTGKKALYRATISSSGSGLDTFNLGEGNADLSEGLPLWTLSSPVLDPDTGNIEGYSWVSVIQTPLSVVLYFLSTSYTGTGVSTPDGAFMEFPGKVIGGGPRHLVIQYGDTRKAYKISSDTNFHYSAEEIDAPQDIKLFFSDNLGITEKGKIIYLSSSSPLSVIFNAGTQIWPIDVSLRSDGPVDFVIQGWDGSSWVPVEEIGENGTNRVKVMLYPKGATWIEDVRVIYVEVGG